MAKQISFDSDARVRLKAGIDALANAVKELWDLRVVMLLFKKASVHLT